MIGQSKLGRYEVLREIGRSNDIILEGWDSQFNRRVAIKVLDLSRVSNDTEKADRIARFEREARAVGSLQHPNIMQVHDLGSSNGCNFMVMELLEGHSLQKEINKRGQLDLKLTKQILEQVLDALAFSHDRGIIHRDLKPDNIQYLPGGVVKLMDFGIARITHEKTMTQTGMLLGTIHYMSPEQVRCGHLDARSDLFSVGSIAYLLLTGNFPFTGNDLLAIAQAIVQSEPVYPNTLSTETIAFLQKSLAKRPDERFQSAEEMRSALLALGMTSNNFHQPLVKQPAPVNHQPPQAMPQAQKMTPVTWLQMLRTVVELLRLFSWKNIKRVAIFFIIVVSVWTLNNMYAITDNVPVRSPRVSSPKVSPGGGDLGQDSERPKGNDIPIDEVDKKVPDVRFRNPVAGPGTSQNETRQNSAPKIHSRDISRESQTSPTIPSARDMLDEEEPLRISTDEQRTDDMDSDYDPLRSE